MLFINLHKTVFWSGSQVLGTGYSVDPASIPSFSCLYSSMLLPLLFLSSFLTFAQAQVTVYGQIAFGVTATKSASSNASAPTTTPAAYNDTRLTPPPIPSPVPANAFTLTLQQSSTAVNGLSIPHVGGSFWGFSIEMSVISQVRKSIFSS